MRLFQDSSEEEDPKEESQKVSTVAEATSIQSITNEDDSLEERRGGDLIFDLSEDDAEVHERPEMKDTDESECKKIYDEAFYSKITREFSNFDLAFAVFHLIKELAGYLETVDTGHKKLCQEMLKLTELTKPECYEQLKVYFAQWQRALQAHEKIAVALSLKEFVFRLADYFEYQLLGVHEEKVEREIAYVLRKIPKLMMPKIKIIASDRDASSLQIIFEENIAYWKLGALRAATDQALHGLACQMGKPYLFAASTPLRIYLADISDSIKVNFGTPERVGSRSGVAIMHRMISHQDISAEKQFFREGQTHVLGSFQPDCSSQEKTAPRKNLLISISVALMLHLRDVKNEDLVVKDGQITFVDAETPLIPGSVEHNLPKIDFRLIGEVFNQKPGPQEWLDLHQFLEGLDEAILGKFLQAMSSDKLDNTLINFSSVDHPPFYFEEIDARLQPELYQYQRLKFQGPYLFSKEQVELFKKNISRLRKTVADFAKLPADPGKSILQFVLEFDPIWVTRFVTFKLYHKVPPNLEEKLFTPENLQSPDTRRVLKTSHDKSSSCAGYVENKLQTPQFSGNELTEGELGLCSKSLGHSLSEEELRVILKQPKTKKSGLLSLLFGGSSPSTPKASPSTSPAKGIRLTPGQNSDD